jgi:hypothetical protein
MFIVYIENVLHTIAYCLCQKLYRVLTLLNLQFFTLYWEERYNFKRVIFCLVVWSHVGNCRYSPNPRPDLETTFLVTAVEDLRTCVNRELI